MKQRWSAAILFTVGSMFSACLPLAEGWIFKEESGFIERSYALFGNGHGKAFPHWLPSFFWTSAGFAFLETPRQKRSNLCYGTRRAYVWVVALLCGLWGVTWSAERPMHKVQHMLVFISFLIAFISSIFERLGKLQAGSSNLLLAMARLSEWMILFFHPTPDVVEDRGHKLAAGGALLSAVAIPFVTQSGQAHLFNAFAFLFSGWIWFLLGFLKCEWVISWGDTYSICKDGHCERAAPKDDHHDMMVLHSLAGVGLVSFAFYVVLRSAQKGTFPYSVHPESNGYEIVANRHDADHTDNGFDKDVPVQTFGASLEDL